MMDKLDAHYGKSHIVRGVEVQVAKGEMVCLLGRNGVGKSTTLKAALGLVKPTGGRVVLNGAIVSGKPANQVARLGLGYVPEERRIFGNITVRENILVGAKLPTKENAKVWNVDSVCEIFPVLRERFRQNAGTLSGGEKQMLTIARTLMGNPEFIMVDEPTEGLAPAIVARLEDVLVQIQRSGIGVLLVEQSREFALSLAQRVYVMSKGQIVFTGTPAELRSNLQIQELYLTI